VREKYFHPEIIFQIGEGDCFRRYVYAGLFKEGKYKMDL